jgi:hypothetical protein
MKCKHGLEPDTCSLCLGYKQTNPDARGTIGSDTLTFIKKGDHGSGGFPRTIPASEGAEKRYKKIEDDIKE